MPWAHSGYITLDDSAERLAELRLHVKEVMDAIANPASYSIDGNNFSAHQLPDYLKALKYELTQLEAQLGAGAPSRDIFYRGIPG